MATNNIEKEYTILQLLEELAKDDTWCDLNEEERKKVIKKFKGSLIEW